MQLATFYRGGGRTFLLPLFSSAFGTATRHTAGLFMESRPQDGKEQRKRRPRRGWETGLNRESPLPGSLQRNLSPKWGAVGTERKTLGVSKSYNYRWGRRQEEDMGGKSHTQHPTGLPASYQSRICPKRFARPPQTRRWRTQRGGMNNGDVFNL